SRLTVKHTVSSPSRAAAKAASIPAWPAPITAISHFPASYFIKISASIPSFLYGIVHYNKSVGNMLQFYFLDWGGGREYNEREKSLRGISGNMERTSACLGRIMLSILIFITALALLLALREGLASPS